MPDQLKQTALLLVGHGTRDSSGIDEFFQTVDQIKQRLPGVVVEPCFLELAEPRIADAVSRAAARGANRIIAVPVTLFAAGHAKRDIPNAVQTAAARFANVEIAFAEHLGCHPALLELSELRFREAVESLGGSVAAEQATLLMVGRGSRDVSATAEMKNFVGQRLERTIVAKATTCFLAMAEPSLEATARLTAESHAEAVVVQPHFLFAGELLHRLRQDVDTIAQEWPKQRWVVAQHLGPHALLADALTDRFYKSRFVQNG